MVATSDPAAAAEESGAAEDKEDLFEEFDGDVFGGSDFVTLPLMLYQQLGAYRMDEASATALLLALLVFVFALGALKETGHAHS